MVNYAVITSLVGNILTFSAGSTLTWSSPVGFKLTHNSTDSDDLPFGRLITKEENSWISSLLALGAVFGPFVSGWAADRFGRKWTLLGLALPFLISYPLLAFSKVIPLYYVARFLAGMGVGGVFTIMPIYVAEIAENSNRGALGSVLNLLLTGGLFFSDCLGPYVSIMWFNIVLTIFPAVFVVGFFLLAPESPHYYIKNGDQESAEQALKKLRGPSYTNLKAELQDITESIKKSQGGSFRDLFQSKALIKGFIISLALLFFQQWSGINAVLFYAQNIFAASGSTLDDAISSIIIGGVQFSTSFITPVIIDRLGRRILLLASAAGMVLSEVPLGIYFYLKDDHQDVSAISWLPVVSLVVYIIAYNFAFGPVPWAVMGEIFPSNVKSIASSVSASFCWFMGFLIGKFFENISDAIGMGESFWMFAGFCLLGFLFCYFYLVETKGKSLQEIQDILGS